MGFERSRVDGQGGWKSGVVEGSRGLGFSSLGSRRLRDEGSEIEEGGSMG